MPILACDPPKVAVTLFELLWLAVCNTGAVASADDLATMPSSASFEIAALGNADRVRQRRGNRQAALSARD